ncbi:MAG TPA: hypothetical protein VF661_12895 [Actinomycetales bacterium]
MSSPGPDTAAQAAPRVRRHRAQGRRAAPPSPPPRPSDAVPHLPTLPTGRVRWFTAGATLALAALLCLAAYAGAAVLAAAAVLLVGVLAAGWPALLALPSPRGTTAVVAAGGVLCVLAVGLSTEEPLLQWLAAALAGTVLLEFLHQLARWDGRPRVVESSTGVLTGVLLLASFSALVALPRSPAVGAAGVLVALLPPATALALQLLPLPARVSAAIGAVAAVLVGALLGGLLPDGEPLTAAAVGGLCAVVALVLHRLLSVLPAAGWAPGWLALAVGPLASSGMVAYLVLRLTLG